MFHVSHLRRAPPPGPNSGGTRNLHVFPADRQCWLAVAVMPISVGMTLSINDMSFIPMCRMPSKYVR